MPLKGTEIYAIYQNILKKAEGLIHGKASSYYKQINIFVFELIHMCESNFKLFLTEDLFPRMLRAQSPVSCFTFTPLL